MTSGNALADHLFGVKSTALQKLTEIFKDRIASADSMAYSFRARVQCREDKVPCTNVQMADHLERWYRKQTAVNPQTLLEL